MTTPVQANSQTETWWSNNANKNSDKDLKPALSGDKFEYNLQDHP